MSLTSDRLAQRATPHTTAAWREQTPKPRLPYLSLLLSHSVFRQVVKYHIREDPDFLLREKLHSARTCIPYLREHGAAIPQGELVTVYNHGGVNGGVDALALAVVLLTAGCVVPIAGLDGELPEELEGVFGPCDDGLDVGVNENNLDDAFLETSERVASFIDASADTSSVDGLLDSDKEVVSETALCIQTEIFKSIEEALYGVAASGKSGISTTRFAVLDDAIEVVNKLCYDTACIYGDTNRIGEDADDLIVPQIALDVSPTRPKLTADGASTLRYGHPQRWGIPFKSHLALLTQYMVGRFDNSAQIAREKASGGQRTAYAIHINNVIDERMEGGSRDGVVHILEETYKYAPGERTPQIAPLILRFEEIDGTIALSSMKAPNYVDKTALRNDNPCLWFGKGELKVSPSFPERQIYRFDESKMEFALDVEVKISETTRFHLSEILARDRLLVSQKLWIGEKLKTGFYEDPFIYDRL